MDTIHAIYENGNFRALAPVSIPDGTEVAFEPRLVSPPAADNGAAQEALAYSEQGLRNVYAILSERYASGHSDTAARHNEHQP